MSGYGPVGRLTHVNVDAQDPERLAAFWGAVLGVSVRGRWEQYVALEPAAPGAPSVCFQRVPEAKAGKNRLHLDLEVDDLDTALARAEALGATLVQRVEQAGERWCVCADPEGNELCLVLAG